MTLQLIFNWQTVKNCIVSTLSLDFGDSHNAILLCDDMQLVLSYFQQNIFKDCFSRKWLTISILLASLFRETAKEHTNLTTRRGGNSADPRELPAPISDAWPQDWSSQVTWGSWHKSSPRASNHLSSYSAPQSWEPQSEEETSFWTLGTTHKHTFNHSILTLKLLLNISFCFICFEHHNWMSVSEKSYPLGWQSFWYAIFRA